MKFGKIFTILGLSVAMISGSMTAYAQEEQVSLITVGYDSETSLATLTTTEKGGTLLYSYKVGTTKDNVTYPVYDKDKIYTFDEKGAYISTSTGNLDKPIFSDDPASWLDYSKTTPEVAQDSDYYTYFLKADGVLQLPYSAESTGQCYIPIEGQEKYISILTVYKNSDGIYSDVVSKDFVFGKEEVEGLKVTVTSISKDKDTEVIKVSASSLDGVDYIQCTYDDEIHRIEKESGSVEYKITDNGTYTIFTYENDNLIPEVSTITISGLSGKSNLGDIEIEKEVNDLKAPVIKVSVPKSATDGKVTVKISTDEKCDINFNGSSFLGVSKAEAVITSDGVYKVTAIDESGNLAEKSFTVSCFENSEGWSLDKDSYWKKVVKHIMGIEPKTGDTSNILPLIIVMSVIGVLGIIMLVVLLLKNKKDL